MIRSPHSLKNVYHISQLLSFFSIKELLQINETIDDIRIGLPFGKKRKISIIARPVFEL